MDQPPEPEVTHHRPAEFDDLLLRVVLEQIIEEVLVDVAVVDEEAFGVGEGGLLGVREVLAGPGADAGDGVLFEGLSSP